MAEYLTTGGERDPFLPKIRDAINYADEIELAVAFIKTSGMDLLFSALFDAVAIRGARLTILTSDYLDVTDPQALKNLMLLSERGADIRVFQTSATQSFHLKAYIFVRGTKDGIQTGSAFIGSSNISKMALTSGLEWNYEVRLTDDPPHGKFSAFLEVREKYKTLLSKNQVIPLSHNWIESYNKRRKVDRGPIDPPDLDPEPPPPEPFEVQREALAALTETRNEGFVRGLVVMATGLGKTFLAAFDADQIGAKRVLFVAHREEILIQAEKTFLRVHPRTTVGLYMGEQRDTESDMLFASVQTLAKTRHLNVFSRDHFDYIIIDEFHHAAAVTYRKLLNHFKPRFLLGLTATPERTDHADILSLCDENLVFDRDLLFGVEKGFLCPFTYYGIHDKSVNYKEIPWRNGRFDPNSLSNKLATVARAKHVFEQWQDKSQERTLAFCVSKKHAQFMADRFEREGIRAAAVFGGSELARDDALERMRNGQLQVIFSVELFNEGVDVPAIDTIMMLRPTESKVLFLQQFGRGLRNHVGKERLAVLDFIGNHRGFLNKPQALFGIRGNRGDLAEFARRARDKRLELPPGCFVNYDLEIIDFLIGLAGDGPSHAYRMLKDMLGRRPTITEYWRSGASVQGMRQQHGNWWRLVKHEGDLTSTEADCLDECEGFFAELATTKMTKCFKAVLVEALLELDGFYNPPTLHALAVQSGRIFGRRRRFVSDIHRDLRDLTHVEDQAWFRYWRDNPINAWIGGNRPQGARTWFTIANDRFEPNFAIIENLRDDFNSMVQELIDYRMAQYEPRLPAESIDKNATTEQHFTIPYFPDVRIACGHFRSAKTEADEFRTLGPQYGLLEPATHFIACAVGDSMDGGEEPVRDGDYLLLERFDRSGARSLAGATVIVERTIENGDNDYVLRTAEITPSGQVVYKAQNPDYDDYEDDESMQPIARLTSVLNRLEFEIGREFKREAISQMFGETFNPGNWHSGHVVLNTKKAHILFVTINKQGRAAEYRYHDRFADDDNKVFRWQSQNSTSPGSKRGRELIGHASMGIAIHLFIREHKLAAGKAAPFTYYGPVRYITHSGSKPMTVDWAVGKTS